MSRSKFKKKIKSFKKSIINSLINYIQQIGEILKISKATKLDEKLIEEENVYFKQLKIKNQNFNSFQKFKNKLKTNSLLFKNNFTCKL